MSEKDNYSNILALKLALKFLYEYKTISFLMFLMFYIPLGIINFQLIWGNLTIPAGLSTIFLTIILPPILLSGVSYYLKGLNRKKELLPTLNIKEIFGDIDISEFFLKNILISIAFLIGIIVGEFLLIMFFYLVFYTTILLASLVSLLGYVASFLIPFLYSLSSAIILLVYFLFNFYLFVPIQALVLLQNSFKEAFLSYFNIFKPSFLSSTLNKDFILFIVGYYLIFLFAFFIPFIVIATEAFYITSPPELKELMEAPADITFPKLAISFGLLAVTTFYFLYMFFYIYTASLFALYKLSIDIVPKNKPQSEEKVDLRQIRIMLNRGV
jgi:hypothetical protein